MRRLLNTTFIQSILVEATSSEALGRAESEVADVLRQRRRSEKATQDDFSVQNQATLLRAQRETSRSMTFLIASVAGIALLVGGVGILAIMMISIRERRKEIGLRRALGARFRDILVQFLMESGLVAVAGGFIGMVAGILVALAADALGFSIVFSWPSAAVGLIFSLTTGIVFGLYPALRAARLQPIAALRAD
jgi:putative ABC transport system permease protein